MHIQKTEVLELKTAENWLKTGSPCRKPFNKLFGAYSKNIELVSVVPNDTPAFQLIDTSIMLYQSLSKYLKKQL